MHAKFVPVQSTALTASTVARQMLDLCLQFGSLVYSGVVLKALLQAHPLFCDLLRIAETRVGSAPCDAYHSYEHFQNVQSVLQQLVCLQLDRNLHCLVFQCPRLFWENMMDLYVRDPNYLRVFIDERQWLKALRSEWSARSWGKIAPLYSGARASSAYYLPKNKDVLKNRPITPGLHHPLRNLYSISSRGLSFVLESADFDHFNLPATTGFKAWVVRVNSSLTSIVSNQQPVLSVFGHDIKEMYTKLLHDRTRDALHWLVSRVQEQHVCNVLSVKRRGRRGVMWGRNGNSRIYATVTLQQLTQIAIYELEHTFIKVGCVFMWQQVGLAMGGFNSPPLAVITCAVAEYHWLRSLGADAKLVHGTRYMDDSTLAIAADSIVADSIVSSYRANCYGGGLVLESTGDCSSGELEILECLVSVKQGQLCMRHRNRNVVSMQHLHKHDGQLAFMKVVPYTTAVPVPVLVNTAVGMLHRIEMNTSAGDWQGVLGALLASDVEYMHLGYPAFFLLRCLKRALPSLLQKDTRWILVAATFSYCVGARWRPWHSLR